MFANMFEKFIFPRTSGKPGENDKSAVPTITWKLLEIGKSSHKLGREQKFWRTQYPLSCEHPLCLSKKPTGDVSPQIVFKPCTNYTNIVFMNKMFASVYVALQFTAHQPQLQLLTNHYIMSFQFSEIPLNFFENRIYNFLKPRYIKFL